MEGLVVVFLVLGAVAVATYQSSPLPGKPAPRIHLPAISTGVPMQETPKLDLPL